ncbi:FecR family protein [Flexithrix dorotheae]|uniref:FecR family protein n=1 Tax=Flexithrix dorotheae TaxID=70993 RepID=UPI000367D68E|nr:FecR family protein [Flexithrix dorotheae]
MENINWPLLAKYFNGEATELEKAIIKTWMKDPEKREIIESAKANLDEHLDLEVTFDSDRIKKLLDDKIKLHERFQSGVKSIEKKEPKAEIRFISNKHWLNLAASVLLVFSIGLMAYYFYSGHSAGDEVEIKLVEKVNPKGQRSVIKLPDGSKVWLNAVSKIKIPEKFSPTSREVFLEGEAFFEIQKDSARPFIVHSGEMETMVLGTSFNVKAFPAEKTFEVVVATGKVSVSGKLESKKVLLLPKQQSIYNVEDKTLLTSEVNLKNYLAWKDGILYFQNEKMKAIIPELEKWYGIEIQVTNSGINEEIFTGEFQNMSLDQVLSGMGFSLGFKHRFEKDTVYLHM